MTAEDISAKKSWRKGCGYVVASLLFFAGVSGFLALRPVREAKRVEQSLTDRFGEVPAWSPAPDGAVPSDRIEAFIRVRERLRATCARFEDNRRKLEDIGRMEEQGELSSDGVLDGFKTALKFGPTFLHLMRSRNEALLEEGMGLGEYSYIYVVAYGDRLSSLANEPEQKKLFKPRTRRELTQILSNQLEALAARGNEEANRDLRAAVQEEIVALESGARAFPWQSGLPQAIEASFEPYDERLDELFCEAAVRFELRQKNQNPVGFMD
jgi:hypothetical protein